MQERKEGLIASIRQTMQDGFTLCGREYRCLAYSSSQLKENGYYFWAAPKPTDPCCGDGALGLLPEALAAASRLVSTALPTTGSAPRTA